jgi:hypothetical protein
MIKSVVHTTNYFQAPADYFWQWTENLEVIEWVNGGTICYRADLVQVLRDVSTDGLPPLSPLLLVIAACQKKIDDRNKLVMRGGHNRFADRGSKAVLTRALEFLDNVSALPEELRRGKSRTHLVYEIFKDSKFVFAEAQVRQGFDELNSGIIDALVTPMGEKVTLEQFTKDFKYLSDALEQFPSVAHLELRLKTGLDKLVEPAAGIKLPDPTPAELLEQLAEDPLTAGLAQLAKQLIPVLNIPMHSQGSGDQSYGGISDITNRGNYDRLLLSELAHDDLLLTARLVNNEALYFRREEPPENPKRQRTILLDVTLKMWGIPRVFAMSAALAFVHNSKHEEVIEAFALRGQTYTEVNLASKAGIIQAMSSLHHALHCGGALQVVIKELPAEDQNEYILVTDERMLRDHAFLESLIKIKESLSFIVTVSRTGDIKFLECIKGNTRVLNTAKLPLEELLFDHKTIVRQRVSEDPLKPAFLSRTPAPLLFPKARISVAKSRHFHIKNIGLVVINEVQRVLLLSKPDKAARELMIFIEKGAYTFGWDGADMLYIQVYNNQSGILKIYEISLSTHAIRYENLSDKIHRLTNTNFISVYNSFYVESDHVPYWFDCNEWKLLNADQYGSSRGSTFKPVPAANSENVDVASTYLARGSNFYSVMYTIREMYVSDKGKLVLGNYTLDVENDSFLRIRENVYKAEGSKYSKVVATHLKFLKNKYVKFTLRVWEDGSQAIIDSRGFLHLKSSDSSIPEMTIVLVTGTLTACWTDDGRGVTAGVAYFINDPDSPDISVGQFYNKYIQPFIDRLG